MLLTIMIEMLSYKKRRLKNLIADKRFMILFYFFFNLQIKNKKKGEMKNIIK